MGAYYQIHTPHDWDDSDLNNIKKKLSDNKLREDPRAAIGEGAGGHGFETIVEVLLEDPIVQGLISATIFKIAEILWRKKPTKKKLPDGLPERMDAYRLVVHVKSGEFHTIIAIDLRSDLKDIETAVKVNLERKLKKNPWRIDQDKDNWSVY